MMAKVLRRQDITFEDKDQALRHDVHMLGALIGDLLKEQGGEELFEFVETARLRAIRRREGNEIPGEGLSELVSNLDLALAMEVIRAFSTYFQMANTAEKVHRIRGAGSTCSHPASISLAASKRRWLNSRPSGFDVPALQQLLDSLHIEPVFTAHPTEPTRRTILRKEQHIVKQLIDMLDPTMTAQEKHACIENIKLEVTTGWQTAEHPTEQMTVADELEHVLFFITDVLYRAMPPFYEDIENASVRVFGEEGRQIRVPDMVHFASWVGGDMDGNPNVNAKTIRSTVARQRSLVLDLYFRECAIAVIESSASHGIRTEFGDAMLARTEEYRGVFPNAFHAVPARHRDMPYRVFLRLVQQRLQATYDDDAYPYESAAQFRGDIEVVASSLEANKGQHAGLFAARRLLRRISTFGFHLLTLDVRQDAMVHRKVIAECLGIDDWLEWSPEDRAARESSRPSCRAIPHPNTRA